MAPGMSTAYIERMTLRTAAVAALALALGACGTPTPYVPAGEDSRHGYATQRLEENRFRVSFSGNSLTDRSTVENYLLYRAAEITRAQGKDYFVVVNRDIDADTTYHTTYDPWPLYRPHRYWEHPFFGHPYWGPGFGYAPLDATSHAVTRYDAHAEIVLHSGRKPADDPRAFDARAVLRNLGPAVVRLAPRGTG